MRDFIEEERAPHWERSYFGCYLGKVWKFRDNELVNRKLGEIHLVNGEFGAGVFAHELQHFLVDWIKAMKWTRGLLKKYWEDIAYMAGDLTTEFWNNFYENFEEAPG